VQHSHIVEAEASIPASVFSLVLDTEYLYDKPFDQVIKIVFTKHPQYQQLEFTGEHYTTVAEYFMTIFLHSALVFSSKSCYSCADHCHYFSLCQSADEFHMAEHRSKGYHSENLSVLLYIAHLLPLACMSKDILVSIFLPKNRTSKSWEDPRNFHANFTLNGWNDHIIQPARDAVLDYYKVRTLYPTYAVLALIHIQSNIIYSLNQRYADPSDVEEYMRVNNLS